MIKEEIAMSKWDKLLERILALSNDMRFDELRKVFGGIRIYNECTTKRQQSLYISETRLYAHNDSEARTD